MSIIIFILVLATLVLVHETGHFIAAKKAGIRVDEFGIGFPPRLFSKKFGETVYSINLFPLGGFVKIFGEDAGATPAEDKDLERSLTKKSKLVQAWVMVAGIVFNLVFAWLILSMGFMIGMPYSVDGSAYGARVENAALTITQVYPKSPADIAGLMPGDKITTLSSGSTKIENPDIKATQDFILNHSSLSVTYVRGDQTKTALVSGTSGIVDARNRAIGVSLDMAGILKLPVPEALYYGGVTTITLTKDTTVGLVSFLKNIAFGRANFSEVSGPIGIVGVVQSASALGFIHLISLVALISINLAVINFIPFPALDGGRIFFLLIESIKRSPIKTEVANLVNSIGFLLLILLMIFVTYHDVLKLIHK